MTGEQRPFDLLPISVFPSVAERFFCFGELIATLDWVQLHRIVESFNVAAQLLVFHSNQLGGLTTLSSEAQLVTGVPAVWGLLRESVPAAVLVATIRDTAKGDLSKVPPPHRRIVRAAYREGVRELREYGASIGQRPPDDETLRYVHKGFWRLIGARAGVRRALCFGYWNEFSAALQRMQTASVLAARDDVRAALPRDCYLLVEGASDQIVFQHFLNIVDPDALIDVLDCGSKNQVVAKFRTIVEHELFIGGIVTVVDNDAAAEADELQRLQPGRCRVRHFRLRKGEVEDLFRPKSHAAAMNRWSSGGEEVLPSDFTNSGRRVMKELKAIAWTRKKASFDKRAHARELIREITRVRQIPAEARLICEETVEIARRVHETERRGASVVNVDQQMRRLERELRQIVP